MADDGHRHRWANGRPVEGELQVHQADCAGCGETKRFGPGTDPEFPMKNLAEALRAMEFALRKHVGKDHAATVAHTEVGLFTGRISVLWEHFRKGKG